MDMTSDSPEAVARAFLAALDEQRWWDAAALVDADAREGFRAFTLGLLGDGDAAAPHPPRETHFASPLAIIRATDRAEAERLDGEELLARFAEGIHPGNVRRLHPPLLQDDGEIRIRRTLVGVDPRGDGGAWARYRTEWLQGEARNDVGEHRMALIRTEDGWRVHDTDLSGFGGGHILPPG